MDGWAFSWATFNQLLAPAQADLLNKRHCLCYCQSQLPVPPWSLCPMGGRMCRLTGCSAEVLHIGSGWHLAPRSASPQSPTPQIGSTF